MEGNVVSKANTPIGSDNSLVNTSESVKITELKKKNKILLIAIVLLIISTIGILVYYVFFQSPINTPDENDKDTSNNSLEEDTYTAFEMPEYKFSAKVPTYKFVEEENGYTRTYFWTAEESVDWYKDTPETRFYTDYLNSLRFSFYPDGLVPGCGLGCANEHLIVIHIYENKGQKELTEIKDIISANINSLNEDDIDYEGITVESIKGTKWDKEIYTLKDISYGPDTIGDGYLVATPEFVYLVTYYLTDTSNKNNYNESWYSAIDLINSFEFGL